MSGAEYREAVRLSSRDLPCQPAEGPIVAEDGGFIVPQNFARRLIWASEGRIKERGRHGVLHRQKRTAARGGFISITAPAITVPASALLRFELDTKAFELALARAHRRLARFSAAVAAIPEELWQ